MPESLPNDSPNTGSTKGLAIAVLAGGRSRRMGADKANLEFEGEPLLLRILHRLETAGECAFVLAGAPGRVLPPLPRGAVVVADEELDVGPLAGVAALAARLKATDIDRVFVCPCDAPFVEAATVRKLDAVLGDAEGVIPLVGDRPQVAFGLYRKSAIQAARQRFAAGARRLDTLLECGTVLQVPCSELGVEARAFSNVNTSIELAEALATTQRKAPIVSPWRLGVTAAFFVASFIGALTWTLLCFPGVAVSAIVTPLIGVLPSAFLPPHLRRPVAKLWACESIWLHLPSASATVALGIIGRVPPPLLIVTSVLGAAIWLTRWTQPNGLRGFETESVSFVGVAMIAFPLNVVPVLLSGMGVGP